MKTYYLAVLLFFGIVVVNYNPCLCNDDEVSLEEQIAGLQELQRRQAVAVEGKFKKLQNVDDKLSQATVEIAGLKEQVAKLLSKKDSGLDMSKIETAIKIAMTPIQESITGMKTELNQLKNSMTKMESTIAQHQTGMDGVTKKALELETAVNATLTSNKVMVQSLLAPMQNETILIKEKHSELEVKVNETLAKCLVTTTPIPEPLLQLRNATNLTSIVPVPKCHRVVNLEDEVGFLDYQYSTSDLCIITFNIASGKGVKFDVVQSSIPSSRCGRDHLSLFEFYRKDGTIWHSNAAKLCSKGNSITLSNAFSVVGVFHSMDTGSGASKKEYSIRIKIEVISTNVIAPKHRTSNIIILDKKSTTIKYPEDEDEEYDNDTWATTIIARPGGVSYSGEPNLKWTYTGVDIELGDACKYDIMIPFGITATKRGNTDVDVSIAHVGNGVCGTWTTTQPPPFIAKDGIILIMFSDESNSKAGYSAIVKKER